MDYEAQILELLSSSVTHFSASLKSSNVHAVRLISYEKEPKLREIQDGGSRNLNDAYTDTTLDVPRIGEELAKWLGALHMCSQNISLALPGQRSNNNPFAVNICRHSYKNLHTALSQFGHDPQLAHRIDEEFGGLLKMEDESVCHGDFWPGNVLVRPKEDESFWTIVDWELDRRGTSATDFAAIGGSEGRVCGPFDGTMNTRG